MEIRDRLTREKFITDLIQKYIKDGSGYDMEIALLISVQTRMDIADQLRIIVSQREGVPF